MFNPLPAIALLPLALIWFGLGYGSIVFVIIHSVLWAVALNTHSGFLSVSNTLRMVGRNYGLAGLRYVGAHPDSGGVSEHPDRTQDRLGVCVADADRRASWCSACRPARAASAGSSTRTRTSSRSRTSSPGLFTGDPHRSVRRERDLPRRSKSRTVRRWGMQN